VSLERKPERRIVIEHTGLWVSNKNKAGLISWDIPISRLASQLHCTFPIDSFLPCPRPPSLAKEVNRGPHFTARAPEAIIEKPPLTAPILGRAWFPGTSSRQGFGVLFGGPTNRLVSSSALRSTSFPCYSCSRYVVC
jgi:hypothetical protein